MISPSERQDSLLKVQLVSIMMVSITTITWHAQIKFNERVAFYVTSSVVFS